MENNYEHLQLCVGHKSLFGKQIHQEELISIISQYPVPLWLDLFSKIEGFLLVPKGKDFNPQKFLTDNLFCLSALERTKRKAQIDNIYFSLGQLNLLRKLAIVYGNDSDQTEINLVDLSKVFLSAQDIHNEYDELTFQRSNFESFCKFVVRNGYLNDNTNASTLFFRTKKIYLDQSNKVALYPDKSFNDFFKENIGITPKEAMALNFAIVNPFFQPKETLWNQTTIIPTDYFRETKVDPAKVNFIIDTMVIDFNEIKQKLLSELDSKNLGTLPVGYDLDIFRKTPLVRLPDKRLVCTNLSCLLEKSTQNIIWMTIRKFSKSDRPKLINDLTNYRGRLFEEYLKDLCSVMVEKNKNLSFEYIPPSVTNNNEEVGDSILIQDNKLLIFEAKSRQFLESFKTTGDWEKDPKFITEFVKAAHQIEVATDKILSKVVAIQSINVSRINKVYPVIVIYESVPMHGKMQRFIRQKVQESGYLVKPIFAPLEVLNIADMEDTIDSVDTLSLIDLLNKKSEGGQHASESNFHNFLAYYFSTNEVICNGWQKAQAEETTEEVFNSFFKDKFIQKNANLNKE